MVTGVSNRAAQKRAVAASSAKSGVVAEVPIAFTSLKSCAYRALDNAGDGSGRKAEGDSRAHVAVLVVGERCERCGELIVECRRLRGEERQERRVRGTRRSSGS